MPLFLAQTLSALVLYCFGMSDTRFIPLSKWPDVHLWPSVGGLRYLITHSEKNGLANSRAIVRVGRRVLIDEARFIAWVRQSQRGALKHRVSENPGDSHQQTAMTP